MRLPVLAYIVLGVKFLEELLQFSMGLHHSVLIVISLAISNGIRVSRDSVGVLVLHRSGMRPTKRGPALQSELLTVLLQ